MLYNKGGIIDKKESYTTNTLAGFDIKTSIPERAALEMLYYVPEKQDFDEAMKIVESMTTLRPEFERSIKVQSLSFADLYGTKICAALDRQHPRDLFDVKILLDNEGITDEIRTAFIIYLISHNRPMNELLNPTFLDISHQFEYEFKAMMLNPIKFDELNQTRVDLINRLMADLTEHEKQFIISVKSKKPKWD